MGHDPSGAAALAPASVDALGTLAAALARQGRFDEALALGRRLRVLDPASAEAAAGDSVVWTLLGDFACAENEARRAVVLKPDSGIAHVNRGLALHSLGRLEEARAAGERALRLDPRSAVARFNPSMTLLKAGELAHGWTLYEARWRMPNAAQPVVGWPMWDGGALAGRTILLHAEQGHGDTLHFVRYAPLVAARGGRVILMVQPGLKRLIAGMPGVQVACGYGEPLPPFDVHAPLMSLPRLFGTTLETIPAAIPYLRSPAGAAERWEARLKGERRLKIGLVWAGDAHRGQLNAHVVDKRRSIALAALAPLAGIPGVVFVSLQKGEPAAQAKQPPPGLDLVDWMDEIVDFADTAALVEQLDLVITVDTSMCHLAGALGKPVWVLSRFDGCWRWLKDRDDTPWYPTMRLFRQDRPGEWGPVVERVAAALTALSRPRRRPPSGRLALPDVTVVCADTRTHAASLRALRRCRDQGDFARVVFFTDADVAEPGIERVAIPRLDGREAYSRFLLKDLVHHVDTPFVLVVQWDGFITDPARWCDEFRRYDYIGARWPWHTDGCQVGNGGFSLRSMRLLRALQDPRITDVRHEDVSIGRLYRRHLEAEHGIAFAPPETADRFAYERSEPRAPTFGFHGLFNVWRHMGRDELLALLAELPPAVLAAREGQELAKALAALGRMEEFAALRRRAGAPHERLIEEAAPTHA